MSSGIVRVRRRTSAYVMMDKTALMDARLSWRAKGLLAHLLSRPDDWKVLVSDLVRHAKDGRDSTRRALQELRTYGYASLRIARDARGVIREWEFLVYETPEDRERMEREDAEQGTLFDPARPVPQPRPKPGPKDRRQQRRRERAFKREVTAELGTPAGDSAKPETANPYLAGAPQPDTDSPDLASPEVGGPSLASISSTNERPTNTAAAACAQSARNSEVMTASHAVAPDAAAAVAVAVGGQTTPEADPEAVKQLVERERRRIPRVRRPGVCRERVGVERQRVRV